MGRTDQEREGEGTPDGREREGVTLLSRVKVWLLLFLSLGTTMLTFINMGAITAATPDMSGTFVVGVLDVSWSGVAAPVGFVLCFPLASYLWSRVGLRRAFRVALLTFFVGCVLGLVADYFLMMVAARWLQGFGSGMTLVYGTGALLVSLPADKLKRWNVLKITSLGVASCISPIIGCLLVQYWNWRGLFVLVGIAVLIFSALSEWLIPDHHAPKRGKFDWMSFFFLAAGCLCMLMFIIRGETDGWDTLGVQAWMYGGVCAFILLLVSCVTRETPLLDFGFFLNARFTLGAMVAMLNIFCICWVRAGIVQYMRNVMLYEPKQIGAAFVPCLGAFLVTVTVLVPLVLRDRLAPRLGMMLGLSGLGGAAFFLARLNTGSSLMDIEGALLLFGSGYALCLLSATPLALRGLPLQKQQAGSLLLNTGRHVCMALYLGSVSTVVANMSREYRFSVAEQTREGAPGVRHTLGVWQEHFLSTGSTYKEAGAEVQAFLQKAVSLQVQVFAMDRFFIVAVLAGCIGILLALCCLRPSSSKKDVSS